MKKKLYILGLAGLTAVAALSSSGCGSDDTVNVVQSNSTVLREYAIIANNQAAGSFTVKGLNLQNGTSSVINNQFTTGVGANPILVKTHPNINVFYVLNRTSGTISQYTLDRNGGAAFLGTVNTPANPMFIVIHPSGGLVYVGAAPNGPGVAGSIRRYTVASSGVLTAAGADVLTTNSLTNNVALIKDTDFSFGGGALHVPEVNKVETFSVATDGTLTATAQANTLGNANFEALDVDVRPGQASLVAVVRTNEANDRLFSFPVNNGVLGASTNIAPATVLNMGDFASNGQYYAGHATLPQMFGYNVDNATGALTALATNPMAVSTGVSSRFVALDPSNNFMLSTGGVGDNVLVARFRGQNGEFIGSTADSQSLFNASGFDFFTFNF